MSRDPSIAARHQSATGLAVAIIGGGVCGLGIGWRLAQAGADVMICDAARAGRAASWAAAGMLAAQAEAEPGEEPLLALGLESQSRWPAFARALEAASGIGIDYRPDGILTVAATRDEEARLRFTYDYQRDQGLPVAWLGGSEARAREPGLHPRTRAAVLSAEDHQVDSRQLVAALIAAFTAAGGRLHEQTEVLALDRAAGRATGVVVRDQGRERHHRADVVLLTAGAWSPQLPGLPDDIPLPIRPVKGQSLSMRMDPQAPLLRHMVWVPGGYLVPRNDGRLIVGATVEEKGFDDSPTAGGVLALLHLAWAAVPAIQDLPLDEIWTGFRPGSRDDAPILGRCGLPNLFIAAGHHRNGILLLPTTADDMARLIIRGDLSPAIAPFGPQRFAQPDPMRIDPTRTGPTRTGRAAASQPEPAIAREERTP